VCLLTPSLLSGFQKKCSESVTAIAHDEDLQIVESMVRPRQMFEFGATSKTRAQEAFTADAVERFLHENKVPVLIEDGGIYPMPFDVKRGAKH